MNYDLKTVWECGQVRRWHANPRLAAISQTDADHSWGVITIALAIFPTYVDRNFLIAAQFHDCGERFCGDLPADFKNSPRGAVVGAMHKELEEKFLLETVGRLPPLTMQQQMLLKICDRIEAILFALCYSDPCHIDGWHEMISDLSTQIWKLDQAHYGERNHVFEWVDKNINPLIRKADPQATTITPF